MMNLSRQLNTGFVEIKLARITTIRWALDSLPASMTKNIIILGDFTENQDMLVTEMSRSPFIIILYLSDRTTYMSEVLTFNTAVEGILRISFFPTNITAMKGSSEFVENERMFVVFMQNRRW